MDHSYDLKILRQARLIANGYKFSKNKAMALSRLGYSAHIISLALKKSKEEIKKMLGKQIK